MNKKNLNYLLFFHGSGRQKENMDNIDTLSWLGVRYKNEILKRTRPFTSRLKEKVYHVGNQVLIGYDCIVNRILP